MSNTIGLVMSLRLTKGVFAALALLAVSVALASPICDRYELPGNAPHHEDGCASLKDGTPAVPPTAAAPSVKPPPFLPLATGWSTEWRAVNWPAAAIPPARPPITRPYHARSARILI
jgi:hypothetical protein